MLPQNGSWRWVYVVQKIAEHHGKWTAQSLSKPLSRPAQGHVELSVRANARTDASRKVRVSQGLKID